MFRLPAMLISFYSSFTLKYILPLFLFIPWEIVKRSVSLEAWKYLLSLVKVQYRFQHPQMARRGLISRKKTQFFCVILDRTN